MNRPVFLVTIAYFFTANIPAFANIPASAQQGEVRWQLKGNRSDDFNQKSLDNRKWDNAPKRLNVGAWTFAKENAFVTDGKLNIMATQETHTRPFRDVCLQGKKVDRKLYYKSGAVQTKADGVYGYYEAKIKGVKMFPGLSPAFWLYSDGHPFDDRDVVGSVDYSEIDVVELQQADWHGPKFDDADPINMMDHNLHARIVGKNGKTFWRRPKPYPEEQLLQYEAPFDPSLDFHTYAVENRKDKISWYVDGKLVGSKQNLYWHRPMHVIFSMGLRRQFIKFNPKCQRADPNSNNVTSEGFPEDATMQVDYVKVWQAMPSVWLEQKQLNKDNINQQDNSLNLTVHYHGGSNDYVVENDNKGLTLQLIEKNQQGFVRALKTVTDTSVVDEQHKYGGSVNMVLNLDDVKASSELAPGHYYALAPSFKSSNGSIIWSQVENKIEL